MFQSQEKVIALYNYTKADDGDLELIKVNYTSIITQVTNIGIYKYMVICVKIRSYINLGLWARTTVLKCARLESIYCFNCKTSLNGPLFIV